MKIDIDGWAWLPKSEMTSDNVEWLKNVLTIKQKISKEYEKRSKGATVELFRDEETRIGVPREFFFDKLTKNHDLNYGVSRGDVWPARLETLPAWEAHASSDPSELTSFDIEKGVPVVLRGQQEQAVSETFRILTSKQSTGGLIQAPTGFGKTIISLDIIKRLKLKTAVLVHREFVLNQWRKRILRYMPDAKVGIIAGDKWDVEGCHIVLVMIQTLSSWAKKKKVPAELPNMFGLTIHEEVHRGGAPFWSLAIPIFNAAYRIGISAAPKRSDGLDKVFFYHIGPKIFTGTEILRIPKIRRVWSNYKLSHPRFNPSMMSMEFAFKMMSADPVYNQDVIDQIKLALQAGRKILVYSHTVLHLKRLKDDLDAQWKESQIKTSFFIGGMTEDELDESAEANVIFATYQMAKDSLDIPDLDTVVLAGPIRNPQQPAGRACREHPDKKDPVVVDMRADNVPVFKEYGESRDKAYIRIYGDQVQPNLPEQKVIPNG